MNPEDIGSQEILTEIKATFNKMYDDVLKSMQINLDENQLGLQRDLLLSDTVDGKSKTSKVSELNEITLKWNALELGIKESEFECDCLDVELCRPLKRIEFIMDLFERYFLKQIVDGKCDQKMNDNILYIGIMTECLSDYNGIALIDDLDHIRGHKEDVRTIIGTYCHRIDGKDGSGECIGEMMRKCRESERTENVNDAEPDDMANGFKHFVNGLCLRERNLLETSTKIHSFICHQVHDENGDQKEDDGQDEMDEVAMKQQSKTPHEGRSPEALCSKFVNEVHDETVPENTECKRMDDLAESLRAKGLSDDHCTRFMFELQSQCYDSETIIDDLVDEEADPFNHYHHSNLFPMLQNNLFLAKITKKHFRANRNDDDELPPFSFGTNRLFHWKYFKRRPGFVAAPKYGSLKEECLQNAIHRMTLKQFTAILFNAFTLKQSVRGRKLMSPDRGATNCDYQVPVNSPVSVAHIFSLLMYCNDTDLQYKYKKFGCRESDAHQSLEDLKESNAEVAWWYKLLVEMVHMFGEKVRANQVLFTGLNVKLGFQTFAPVFNAPFSTTVSLDVAKRFCGADGVILKMKPAPGSRDRFCNVEWLSDFAHEKERFFVFADNLRIADIRYFQDDILQKNFHYLRSFALFSALFNGHFISPLLRMKSKKRGDSAGILLLNLIRVYESTNGLVYGDHRVFKCGIPLYIQQLFYQLLDGFKRDKKRKFVIKSECLLLTASLRKKLVEFSDDSVAAEETLQLSPLMSSVCDVQQIVMMEEYIWLIYGEQLVELQTAKSMRAIRSERNYFKSRALEKVSFECEMKRFPAGSSASFGIVIKDTAVPIDGRWSVIIDEVAYNRNACRFSRFENGDYDGYFTFDNSLYDTVEMLTVKVALHFTPSS